MELLRISKLGKPFKILARVALILTLASTACSDGGDSGLRVLTAEMPLHLEDHLDEARIEGSEVSQDVQQVVKWDFTAPQTDWKPVESFDSGNESIGLKQIDGVMRLTLSEEHRDGSKPLGGAVYVEVPEWRFEDWAYVLITAQTSSEIDSLRVGYNLPGDSEPSDNSSHFRHSSNKVEIITDGTEQTYLIEASWKYQEWEGPWKQFGIEIQASEPARIDISSISIVPKEAKFSKKPVGVHMERRGFEFRRSIASHTPGKITFRVLVPENAQLDFGMGSLREEIPVTFRVIASSKEGRSSTLFEEPYSNVDHWGLRSVDLSRFADQTIELTLEADAQPQGSVALWAAPTMTSQRPSRSPNIILYVIDTAGADYMSVYGYNRRTTPNLERLAEGGLVFEHAYSTSEWTKPSTTSFMTSFHNSVLGVYKSPSTVIPEQARIMGQHMHEAAYQTGVFIANPYVGTFSGLDRGVDFLQDASWAIWGETHTTSSVGLHQSFWRWRESFPGAPYWAHFQTLDVHQPWFPPAPFSGLFISPERRKKFHEINGQRGEDRVELGDYYSGALERSGIDRLEYYRAGRDLYDEAMAHNDYQIGRLIARLKTRGEWENTLLIITSDHSKFGQALGLLDPLPPLFHLPMRRSLTRVPLIVVWPARIPPGKRIEQPVSLIDLLPTVLDLAGLPVPPDIQGKSLASAILTGEGGEPRPVIIEDIAENMDSMAGSIEVIDGRWGASLLIQPDPPSKYDLAVHKLRPSDVVVYDLWTDPLCLNPLNNTRPDLVEKYEKLLRRTWREHTNLAKHLENSGHSTYTIEQLKMLRSLGYVH